MELVKESVAAPNILSSSEFQPFWISWYSLNLKFGRGEIVGTNELLSYTMQNVPSVSSVSVACNHLSGAEWLFKPVAPDGSKYCFVVH